MGRIMMNGIQYGTGGRPTAEGVTYDNAESGMTAKNVQGALDELSTGLTTQTGTFTKVSSKISSVEFAKYVKWGKVCVANVNFTVGTAITGTTETLFTGLPAAAVYKRFFAMQVQSKTGVYARLEVNTSGEIRNAYTSGNISTGQYEGVITYITRD